MKEYLQNLDDLIEIGPDVEQLIEGIGNTQAGLDRLIGVLLSIKDTKTDYKNFRTETTSIVFNDTANANANPNPTLRCFFSNLGGFVPNVAISLQNVPPSQDVKGSYLAILEKEITNQLTFVIKTYKDLKAKIYLDYSNFNQLKLRYELLLNPVYMQLVFAKKPSLPPFGPNELLYYNANLAWIDEAMSKLAQLDAQLIKYEQAWVDLYQKSRDVGENKFYASLANNKKLLVFQIRRLLNRLDQKRQPILEKVYQYLIYGVTRYDFLSSGNNIRTEASNLFKASKPFRVNYVRYGKTSQEDNLFSPVEAYFKWYTKK